MLGIPGAVVVMVGLVAGCSTSAAPTRSADPTESVRPSGPLPIKVGQAEPNVTYTTSLFEPTITFAVPTEGWLFFFPDDEDEMAVGQGGDIELLGGRVATVVDPTSHQPVDAPDDLIAWLEAHPDFVAQAPQPATIAGREARSIDVSNPSDEDIDVWAYPTGNARVSARTDARIWVVPLDGPDLVFTAVAGADRFDAAVQDMATIVESVQIEP